MFFDQPRPPEGGFCIPTFKKAHNFIRADEENTKNRLRDSRWVPNDNKSGQGYKDTSKRHKDKYVHRTRIRPKELPSVNNSSFTPLIKSPTKIYATSEGKAVLQPPSRMFMPAHRRDRTREREPEEATTPVSPENKSKKEEMEINPLYPDQKVMIGHMITKKGIEANPEKVKTIVDMVSPRTVREVQSLNGKLAALGRFLAKSAEKVLPFFKTLKGCMNKNNFQWTQEAELAFQELKQHLKSLPALTVPTPGETLILYLAVSHETISSVLMAERENVQKPIYFVNKTLQGPKINYSEGSGAGLILTNPDRDEITYALRFEFPASNNKAKNKALIAGLELAIKMEVRYLQVFSDSLLMTNHMKGSYEACEERTDALSKLTSSTFAHLTKKVLVEVIPCRSTEAAAVNVETESEVTWMNPIIEYLKDERLLDNLIATRKIQIKASQYSLNHGSAFRIMWSARGSKGHCPKSSAAKVEATPLATITGKNILKFVWTNIVCRFGISGIIVSDNGIPTYRISSYDEDKNNEELRLNLELLEERREMAAPGEAKYKHQTKQYYNQTVRHKHLNVGDYILRKNEASRQEGQKKLDPNWEGPYQIIEANRPGTYVLADMHTKTISRTWHASNL
nr:reverse transcriptase domain-containing protein [Tanacetum cinerariifolium]